MLGFRRASVRGPVRALCVAAESTMTTTLEAHARQLLTSLEVGSPREVVPVVRKTLLEKRHDLGDTHPSTIASINSLAGLLILDGKLHEAQPLIRESITAAAALYGERR